MVRKKAEAQADYKKAPDLQNLAKSRKYKYLTAEEVAELFHYSKSHAYRIIRDFNKELAGQGKHTFPGRVPLAYLEQRIF